MSNIQTPEWLEKHLEIMIMRLYEVSESLDKLLIDELWNIFP